MWYFAGLFLIASVTGWIANIIQIVGMVDNDVTALLIIKCVGVFAAPLGSIMGLIGLF